MEKYIWKERIQQINGLVVGLIWVLTTNLDTVVGADKSYTVIMLMWII